MANPISKTELINASTDANSLSVVTNGDDVTNVTSRLGRVYPTIAKLFKGFRDSAAVVLTQIGYAVPVTYASAIVLTSPNQTVSYNGVVYAPISNQLPFTTSGTFETANFRVIQGVTAVDLTTAFDNLANTANPLLGSALVGAVARQVPSIAALRLLPKAGSQEAFVLGYYGKGGRGGGSFYHDSLDSVSQDNGGTVIVAADGGRWKRPETGMIHVDEFGAKVGDAAAAVSNYVAIRSALAAAVTNVPVQLEGQRQLSFGSGEYFIQGNSPLCFNRSEMEALPGGYRYRRGLKYQGTGKMSTILTMVSGHTGALWFFSTYDAAFPTDSSVMDYLQFDGITFRGTDTGQEQGPLSKTNGFNFISYGWEKFITFSNCTFERLDVGVSIKGYGNADHNRWTGCHFRVIRDHVFYFDNNQSVANTFLGCDMEEIYGKCFHVGPTGGGDVHWSSGSVVLYPQVDSTGTPVVPQKQSAFVFWDNSGAVSGPSSGTGNAKFTFNQLRFETYAASQAVVFSYRNEPTSYGYLEVVFNNCSLAQAANFGTWEPPTTPFMAVNLDYDTRVRFNQCVLSHSYTYLVTRGRGEIHFDDCSYMAEYPLVGTALLAGKCTVAGVGGTIQCRGLDAPRLVAEGDYSRCIVPDFTKQISGRVVRSAVVQAKHPLSNWPQLTRSGNVQIFLPEGSLISSVSIDKPADYVSAPVPDYSLSILTSASVSLLTSGPGAEDRAISARAYLTTPHKVPAAPNNYLILAAGGTGSTYTFYSTAGAVYLEYV